MIHNEYMRELLEVIKDFINDGITPEKIKNFMSAMDYSEKDIENYVNEAIKELVKELKKDKDDF